MSGSLCGWVSVSVQFLLWSLLLVSWFLTTCALCTRVNRGFVAGDTIPAVWDAVEGASMLVVSCCLATRRQQFVSPGNG